MKRLSALLLALCLVFSGMTVAVSAASSEDHTANSVRVDAFESLSGGEAIENTETMLLLTLDAGSYGAGAIEWHWSGFEGGEPVSYDMSGTEFIEFDVYVSDVDLLWDVDIEVEISSSGMPNVNENSTARPWNYWLDDTLEDGWNTIRMPFTHFTGTCDLSSVNWIRFLNREQVVVPEGEVLEIYISRFGFGKVSANAVTTEIPVTENGWSLPVSDWKGSRSWEMLAGAVNPSSFLTQTLLPQPLDLSSAAYMEIFCRVLGAEDLSRCLFQIELCAGATADKNCDYNEMTFEGILNDVRDGWQSIRIPLSAFTPGGADGKGNDLTAVNWIRMYCVGGTIADDVTLEIAYFGFSDAGDHNFAEYQVTPGSLSAGESTAPAHPDHGQNGTGFITQVATSGLIENVCQFADNETELVYKLQLDYIVPDYVYMVVRLSGEDMLLQLGNKNREDAYKTVFDAENPLVQQDGKYVIDVSRYCTEYEAGGFSVYLRISDCDLSDNGNGGQLMCSQPVTFIVGYSDWEIDPDTVVVTDEMIEADFEEMLVDEHTRPIFGCNAAIGSWELDYKNFTNGSSSLSYTIGVWEETDKFGNKVTLEHHGTSDFTFQFADVIGEEFVDATNYDTLEIDMYISDIAAFEALQWNDHCLELTSSGTYDIEEISFRYPDWVAAAGGELKSGWNTLRFDITKSKAIDRSHLNYIRFYFVDCHNTPIGLENAVTVKLDNIRVTDYKAQQKELLLPEITALSQEIYDAVKDIAAFKKTDEAVLASYRENYAAWKTLAETLDAKIKALSTLGLEMIAEIVVEGAEEDSQALFKDLESNLSKFERYLKQQGEDPADLLKPDNPPEDNPPEDNPPEDNPPEDNPPEDNPPEDNPPEDNPPEDNPPAVNPGTEKPGTTDPEKSNTTTIIIVVVAVVVVAAGAVAVVLVLKKKKG